MKSEEEQPRYAISLKREIESFIKLNSPTVREYQRRIDYHCKIYSDICQIQLLPIKETGVYTSQRPKYEFTPIKVLNDTKIEVKIQDTMLETNPRFQKDDVLGLSGCLMNGAIGIVNKTKGFTEIYEVPPNCTDPKDLLKGQSVDEIVTVLIKHADRLVINHSVYQKDAKIQQLHYRDPQCSVLIDDNTYLVALAKYDCFYRVTWNGRKYETKSIIMNYQMAKSKKYKIIKMYIHDHFLYCQSNKTIYKLPKDLQLDVYHRMHRPSSFERFYYGTELIIDSALVQSDLSQILVLHQSGEVILLDTLSKFVTCKFTFSPEFPISKLYVPPNFNAQELPLILYENMGKLNMIDIQTCGIEVDGMELINLRNRKVAGQIVNWDDSERMYVVTVDFRGKICLSEMSFSS
ncbi:hypothetical protein FGO68_gene4411 [Halteria grandinella]|uniref:Uncharacterized protein n=1 Tax=Halteria grandinella TaxID=5974 RepID=A0A8J8P4R8_HALGN|nr:hypothetical protein FGO68_gene4411 [Halteria grandinella]